VGQLVWLLRLQPPRDGSGIPTWTNGGCDGGALSQSFNKEVVLDEGRHGRGRRTETPQDV